MIRNICLAGAVLALATAAHAQFTYGNFGGFSTNLSSLDQVRAAGVPDVSNFLTPAADQGSILFGADQRTFQRSFTLDDSQYPTINSASDSMTLTTQAASNRFEFSWDASQSGNIAPPAGDVSYFYQNTMNFITDIRISVTQDAMLRMTWQASASGLVGGNDFSPSTPDNWSNNSVSGTAIPTSFTFGYGDPTVNVGAPFSFDLPVLAGQQIRLRMKIKLVFGGDETGQAFPPIGDSWNQTSNGSFVIEVVPAPSAAGVLVMTSLVAVRRHRRWRNHTEK